MFINIGCATTTLWDKEHYEVKNETNKIHLKGVYSLTDNGEEKGYCFYAENLTPFLKEANKNNSQDCIRLFEPSHNEYQFLSTILSDPVDLEVNALDVSMDDRGDHINLHFKVYVNSDNIQILGKHDIFTSMALLSENDRHYYPLVNFKGTLEKLKPSDRIKRIEKDFPITMYSGDDIRKSRYTTENTAKRIMLTPFALAIDTVLVSLYLIICIIDDTDGPSTKVSFCWDPT